MTGVPRRERRERIDEAIETMELEPMLDRLARTLSGGMLRRLEIATRAAQPPAVLFLDEPTVGLDPTARRHGLGAPRTRCASRPARRSS